jgi:hypothetical protein
MILLRQYCYCNGSLDFKIPSSVIKVFYLPNDAQGNCFKKNIIVRLKQLQHISVQSPSSESALFELAKVTVVKIIN